MPKKAPNRTTPTGRLTLQRHERRPRAALTPEMKLQRKVFKQMIASGAPRRAPMVEALNKLPPTRPVKGPEIEPVSRTPRHECAQCYAVRPGGWKISVCGRVRWLCSIECLATWSTTLLFMAGGHLPRERGR